MALPSKASPPATPVSLNKNARTVLEKRYLVKDETGKPTERPEDLFWRVATVVAEADRRYGASDGAVDTVAEEFYRLMTERRFVPNSPTLMNAGRPLGQLSACFVLPVEDALSNGHDGIYDTLRSMALIHQSGGGCIAGDARVWTTFCGVEPIEVLFNRATVDGRAGERQGSGVAFDVRDLGIRTLSMDPGTGKTGLRPVTHVWKFDVPAESQIVVRTREGAQVQTSDWHPFMVLRGTRLVEVRADALEAGDVILGPERPETFWPWQEERTVGGLTIDSDIAWLTGFTLGDGSFGYAPALRQDRLRWFSGTTDVLERVQAIVAKRGIRISIQRDPRGNGLVLSTLTQDFVHAMQQACALTRRGPKDAIIRVPEHIGKSPLPVVRAFVAGLLDSDGNVDKDGSPSYTTASEEMAQDLAALMSLLGYQPTVRRKEPHGRGKLPTYTVLLCPLPQVDELAADLAPYLANVQRKGRLHSDATKQTSLALDIDPWREALRAHGLVNERGHKDAGPCADQLNRWSCNEGGRVNRRDLAHIAAALKAHDAPLSALLARAARGGQEVSEVTRADTPKPYYDLSVDEWNTYAAGRDGLVMIHNTGFGFSRLRPKGSMVRSTTGVASGPVSFMKLYDASTDAVKQGGTRRGANMGILRVDHPDIMEFITCKEDLTQVVNFNISVAVTTQFMRAVQTGSKYDLIDPGTGKSVAQLEARAVWDKMIEGAWRTGEPGVFFIDEANRYNPVPSLGQYEATNPCVVGSTRLATDRGLLTMEELERELTEIRVVTDDRVPAIRSALEGGVAVQTRRGTTLRHAVPVFRTRQNAPVFALTTAHGYTVTATDNHKFFTPNGLVELKDLKAGDDILLQSGEGAWSTNYALPAFEPTDKLLARVERGEARLPSTWSRELGQMIGFAMTDGWPCDELPYTRSSLGLAAPGEAKRVPETIWRAPREAVIGFLQGLFTADGTVNISVARKTCSVRLSASNKPLLEDVQRLLLNFGIVSKLYLRREAHDKLMPNGKGGQTRYACAPQYELVLDKENRDRFVRTIGFLSVAKQQKAERWLAGKERRSNRERFVTRIVSIKPAGTADVYCTTEHQAHSIVVNGLVTANCGEQPLLAYDVCNLGSINVGYYVKGSGVDWDAFRRDIQLATHFLDNIIDVNKYPLPEIDALSKRIRRIGLGIMGFADMLVRLGIPYDSPDGVEMGRKVMRFLDVEAKRESERLANERGAFPEWAKSI
ncbi:MAG TPA: LAGLIDADG family homing endonuclease, partial [Gemmatimonadaceae bacterium]|nr:LAGLIDADG family homing endonuclease [Gemmatimonadaceae bacterium]